VDKPEGPTSHDIVVAARRAFGTRRVGHAGTLDPFASGLLPLLLGRATRLMPYLVGLPKRYEGTIRLGVRTSTDDRQGDVIGTDEAWQDVADGRLAQAALELTGSIDQVPPAYSAKKLGGVPAHRRLRRGEAVTLEPHPVEVMRFAITGRRGPDATFEAEVGSGTYVRALARDLGAALGCGAHLIALRRTRVGPFDVVQAVAPAALPCPLAPAGAAVPHLERRDLDDAERAAIRNGRPVEARLEGTGPVALFHAGELVAIAVRAGDRLHPRAVLVA
jgi:tRNA pseudouridine55 synthase